MVCIFCNNETEVTNSRAKVHSPSVWRRRLCKSCVAQFTTIELPAYEKALTVVVLNNNAHFPFSRDKLFLSLYTSLGHRIDALTSSTALTDTVISRIFLKMHFTNGEISSHNLAKVTFEVLKRFDPLAANTYKAYHQSALKLS